MHEHPLTRAREEALEGRGAADAVRSGNLELLATKTAGDYCSMSTVTIKRTTRTLVVDGKPVFPIVLRAQGQG